MCIRDRLKPDRTLLFLIQLHELHQEILMCREHQPALCNPCLLYTSDAADERSSVDLGGRRIIKKKTKNTDNCVGGLNCQQQTNKQHQHVKRKT